MSVRSVERLLLLRGGGHTRRVERGLGGQYLGRRKTQLCTLPISNPLWLGASESYGFLLLWQYRLCCSNVTSAKKDYRMPGGDFFSANGKLTRITAWNYELFPKNK